VGTAYAPQGKEEKSEVSGNSQSSAGSSLGGIRVRHRHKTAEITGDFIMNVDPSRGAIKTIAYAINFELTSRFMIASPSCRH
jgi:hypothetical protein